MIAQQDIIYIDVETLGTLNDAQKAYLVGCYKRGTIMQVAQRSASGIRPCIGASFADVSTTRTYTFAFGGSSISTVTVEETIAA